MDKHQQLLKIFDGMQYVIAKHVIDTLNRSNIKYAIVKGCPLAYYKTGRVDTRCSNDIDILIARNDVSRLEIILKDLSVENSASVLIPRNLPCDCIVIPSKLTLKWTLSY